MSVPVCLDLAHLAPDVSLDEIFSRQFAINQCHDKLHNGSGPGSDFLGWLQPDTMLPAGELQRIKQVAKELRERSDVLVLIGIGGSYLGARAVIEAIGGKARDSIRYAGLNISAAYHTELLDNLRGKRVAISVVSKSGTTTESAIAFRLLKTFVEQQVGKEAASKLIVVTTDASKGALRKLSEKEGYAAFVVPDDVGGRYSVFTAGHLLPMAYAGIDIDALLESASRCARACRNPDLKHNPAYAYAAVRNILYGRGKAIEILASFEPRLHYMAEWWKQLFGESEGKDGVSMFPASVGLTVDLHSMGQWIQEGTRNIFETFIDIESGEPDLAVPTSETDDDGVGYLAGKALHEINRAAYEATALAHREGGVPNCAIRIPRLDASTLGALLYFFEKACAIAGYLLGVNPFDQPGVEAYKNHMFALLGRPGFEEHTRELYEASRAEPPQCHISFEE